VEFEPDSPGKTLYTLEERPQLTEIGSLLGSYGVVSTLRLHWVGEISCWFRCTGPSLSCSGGMSHVFKSLSSIINYSSVAALVYCRQSCITYPAVRHVARIARDPSQVELPKRHTRRSDVSNSPSQSSSDVCACSLSPVDISSLPNKLSST
jgi:hypothetical protein